MDTKTFEKVSEIFSRPEMLHSPENALLIEDLMDRINQGRLRAASPDSSGNWESHVGVKQVILLYFRLKSSLAQSHGPFHYCDKIPLKSGSALHDVRVVPGAVVRYGAHIEPGVILMPSFVNVGAHVGSGTMVDTWATVGSCAQVGRHVHLSGGVGIGGVLEPLQARPVILEDHVFVGSRAVVVEGVCVREGAVLGAGVVLTASTKIVDVSGSEEKVLQGEIPPRSVVIPGMRQKNFPSGSYGVPCALIIGKRSASTDEKTSLNDALRSFQVPV